MLLVGVIWMTVIVMINTFVSREYGDGWGSDNYDSNLFGFNKVHSVQKVIEKMRYDVIGENKSRDAEIEFRREYVKSVSAMGGTSFQSDQRITANPDMICCAIFHGNYQIILSANLPYYP